MLIGFRQQIGIWWALALPSGGWPSLRGRVGCRQLNGVRYRLSPAFFLRTIRYPLSLSLRSAAPPEGEPRGSDKFIFGDPNRYRAVPRSVSITDHPGTHWQRGLPVKFQFAELSRPADFIIYRCSGKKAAPSRCPQYLPMKCKRSQPCFIEHGWLRNTVCG